MLLQKLIDQKINDARLLGVVISDLLLEDTNFADLRDDIQYNKLRANYYYQDIPVIRVYKPNFNFRITTQPFSPRITTEGIYSFGEMDMVLGAFVINSHCPDYILVNGEDYARLCKPSVKSAFLIPDEGISARYRGVQMLVTPDVRRGTFQMGKFLLP